MSDADSRARTVAREARPDVRPPKQIAETTTAKGQHKAGLDLPVMMMLGVLAGAYIAFGGMVATVALAGADTALPHGVAQMLAGIVFSLGLILVLVGGAELFTGNTLLVVAWAEERAGFTPVLVALAVAYVTNLVGSLAIALLAFGAGVHTGGEGAVGAAALSSAHDKATLGFGTAFASGIAANILVCLAVWLAFGARSAADKVLVIVPPIAAFVAIGFEHSVANMYLIPFGIMVLAWAGPEFWTQAATDPSAYVGLSVGGFVANLVPVTLGNIVGGFIVGGAYWFAYLRPRPRDG